ncbi:MAG: glycerophosphodiester phosphodiesterase [Clostridia bacterium]|nr:glycerophosphodiester phosphodiesterase [Clostridia bacterium]
MAHSLADERFPAVIAHRGLSAKYPENSIEAFEAAVACGADEIELDVRLTRDGKMIVSHDNRLDRITEAPEGLTVDGCDLDYLLSLNTGYRRGMKARFCRPQEVFSLFGGKIIFNLHLKTAGENDVIVERLAGMIKEYRVEDHVYFAGSPRELERMEASAPEVRRCAIQLPRDTLDVITSAKTYGCFRAQLWSGLYTAETVERLHAEGIGVNLFHAETPEEYAAAMSLGIDAILSNNADLAVGFLGRGS